MPNGLLDAFLNGDVVIFAGAGISTENKLTFPYTLYDDVISELSESDLSDLKFPQVMTKYEALKGRLNLIEKIKARFDYIDSFPELYRKATEFHRELSTIPMVREIITTNWDEYFERECGAMPFVSDEDIAFIDIPERKVLKIHGSINNIGSIVATTKDYSKCKKELNSGLIGSKLKLLLANKTVVFIGYSFADEDFQRVYTLVKNAIGPLSKDKYIVAPNRRDEDFLKKNNLTPIYTAGTYFLHQVRKEISKKYKLLDPAGIEIIELFLQRAGLEHNRLTKKTSKGKIPENFYCQSYQDGLIHAYEYALNKKKDGYIYDLPRVFHSNCSYDEIMAKKRKNKKWWDIAYIKGYQMGLLTIAGLGTEEFIEPQFYYNIFLDEHYSSMNSYSRSFRLKRKNEKSILSEMNKILKKQNILSNDIVFHHTPFLF